MKSYGRGEKLTIVDWDCGKGKLLVLEGSGGGGGGLLNLGCLSSLLVVLVPPVGAVEMMEVVLGVFLLLVTLCVKRAPH
jgi:hypothetical protein